MNKNARIRHRKAIIKREVDARTKRQQGEKMYELIQRVQEWCEANKKPFRGVMIDILSRWCKNRRIQTPADKQWKKMLAELEPIVEHRGE